MMAFKLNAIGGKAPKDLDMFIIAMRNQGYSVQRSDDGIYATIPISFASLFRKSGGWTLLIRGVSVRRQDATLNLEFQLRIEVVYYYLVCLIALVASLMHTSSLPREDVWKVVLGAALCVCVGSLTIIFSLVSSVKRDIKKAVKTADREYAGTSEVN